MRAIEQIVLFILFVGHVICLQRVDPLVSTNVGLIRGLKADDGEYHMFLGVPYGKVDDENPFKDATPYPPFENAFEAYDDSVICPQFVSNNATGNIDCLNLNIYVPTTASQQNPVPVMIYVHGGAFAVGSARRALRSPRFLVQHDVIVVGVHYRVGVYGFMCLDTPDVPGNQGLKDQYLAFEWIKDNIQAFGGDVNRITLFGESAGGHAIDLHLISSKKKLYNNAILQSGSAVATTVLYEPDKAAAVNIAKILGFEARNTDEALAFLSNVDSNLVVNAAAELNIIFKPCAETEFEGVEPFLSTHWINTDMPKIKETPVMIGFDKDEMASSHLFRTPEYYENLDFFNDYFKRVFEFDDEEFVEMKRSVSNFYFADKGLSEDVSFDIVQFDSDFLYIHPIRRTIQRYLENEAKSVYHYVFSYVGSRNALNTDVVPDRVPCCASHADEQGYLFDGARFPEIGGSDEVVMWQMTTMWTNFAKYNDPTPTTSELLPVKWLPLTKNNYYFMDIGAQLTLDTRPHHRRMAFWDLFYQFNRKSQTWYTER